MSGFGGKLRSVDENAIAAMKGVRGVVRLPEAVAVVANSWWRAKCALEALPIVWDDCGNNACRAPKSPISCAAAWT